jgi:integrase
VSRTRRRRRNVRQCATASAPRQRLRQRTSTETIIGGVTGTIGREELRALNWEEVDLEGKPKAKPPIPPSIFVLRSVREGGATKTRKSRRRLAMPLRCVEVLRAHQERQKVDQEKAGKRWKEHGLVFASTVGTEQNPRNVSRMFREVLDAAGMVGKDWTPREMRHSFVSLLSDSGVPLENISRLVGHSGTAVTEAVYRQQIRPVMEEGATAMDRIFADEHQAAPAATEPEPNEDDAA